LQRWRSASVRLAIPVVLALAVAACGDGDGEYPQGWSALQAPAMTAGARHDDTASPACPDLRGTYATTDRVLYGNLVSRFLTREQREFDWPAVTIEARGPDSLALRVVRGSAEDSVLLDRREVFRCADGWLTGSRAGGVVPVQAADESDDGRGYTRQLWITRDRDGRLIGREELVSYRELPALCRGGCSKLRIPGTRRETVRWHRLSPPALAKGDEPERLSDLSMEERVERMEAGRPLPPR
jgi:hypothetical protein